MSLHRSSGLALHLDAAVLAKDLGLIAIPAESLDTEAAEQKMLTG